MLIITEKIKEILKNKNLSQYKAAKLIGYDHGNLGTFIRGDSPFPDEVIKKIAPVLEVSPDTLRGWILADKYPKDLLQKAIQVRQQYPDANAFIFRSKINELMQQANLNITNFAPAIGYNQGLLSQVSLKKKKVSPQLVEKLHNYSNIPKDDIKSWAIADRYSLEALRVAIENS